MAAASLPFVVAVSFPPSPTFFNQLAALALWGLACSTVGLDTARSGGPATAGSAPHARAPAPNLLLLAGALLVAGNWAAWILKDLPTSFVISTTAVLGIAMLVMVSALQLARRRDLQATTAFAWGMAAVGVVSSAIALIQVLAPSWPDGNWIARSSLAGRAVGNLRQPNHLASLLLLSAIALVPLAAMRHTTRVGAYALFALMITGITLSGSRTGMLGIGLLAAWGLLDRRLAGRWRLMLGLAPVLYFMAWAGFSWWAEHSSKAFGAAPSRLTEGDISSSRFAIWSNTLDLIAMHPWAGVGWGNFNLAWSLTPFPNRPTAFFDHTHNIVLQLVVELGLPLGLLITALLIVALWQAGRRAWRAQGESGVMARALFMMVLMMALHSQLEYPLWYAHFLLPTAFAWGACLAWPAQDDGLSTPREAASARPWGAPWMAAAGMVAVLGSAYAAFDYLRVSSIFEAEHSKSLEARIETGRRSLFFAHHADYARATVAEHPGEAMDSIDVAKHHLLDTRLMIAWARAYAERGDLDRARHIAARLREFRNPASKAFFAECAQAAQSAQPAPFQCEAPSRRSAGGTLLALERRLNPAPAAKCRSYPHASPSAAPRPSPCRGPRPCTCRRSVSRPICTAVRASISTPVAPTDSAVTMQRTWDAASLSSNSTSRA